MSNYPHMVHDYYVARVRAIHQERSERLRSIKTKRQAVLYQQEVRKAISRAFSPRPRRTALKPRITGVLQRSGYRIEKLTFESRPGCLVTANLYIPDNLEKPAPGVIGTCGHSMDGKASSLYQGFSQRLAHSGFVVLTYEPFNQGERDQYSQLSERDAVKSCCPAHNMMGKQLELLGRYAGAGLPANQTRSRPIAYWRYRQLRRRNHVQLAVGSGRSIHYGRAQLLCDHVPA